MNRDFFNKQLFDKVFVTCAIIKAKVSVRPRLITLVETMIIPDITKTRSIVALYIVLKKTNTALHGTQF